MQSVSHLRAPRPVVNASRESRVASLSFHALADPNTTRMTKDLLDTINFIFHVILFGIPMKHGRAVLWAGGRRQSVSTLSSPARPRRTQGRTRDEEGDTEQKRGLISAGPQLGWGRGRVPHRTSSVPRRLNIAGRVAVLREERTGLLTGEGFEWHSRKPEVEKSSWI